MVRFPPSLFSFVLAILIVFFNAVGLFRCLQYDRPEIYFIYYQLRDDNYCFLKCLCVVAMPTDHMPNGHAIADHYEAIKYLFRLMKPVLQDYFVRLSINEQLYTMRQ